MLPISLPPLNNTGLRYFLDVEDVIDRQGNYRFRSGYYYLLKKDEKDLIFNEIKNYANYSESESERRQASSMIQQLNSDIYVVDRVLPLAMITKKPQARAIVECNIEYKDLNSHEKKIYNELANMSVPKEISDYVSNLKSYVELERNFLNQYNRDINTIAKNHHERSNRNNNNNSSNRSNRSYR